VAFAVLAVALASAGVAIAAARVYSGGTPKANRYMDISFQLVDAGRKANWRVDVFGPCTENDRLSRTVGTDAGNTPPNPQLHVHAGRFSLRQHATSPISGISYTYKLVGHAVANGFQGTFQYFETSVRDRRYRCNVPLLHWKAHRSTESFS
jgi:hypothetical protein